MTPRKNPQLFRNSSARLLARSRQSARALLLFLTRSLRRGIYPALDRLASCTFLRGQNTAPLLTEGSCHHLRVLSATGPEENSALLLSALPAPQLRQVSLRLAPCSPRQVPALLKAHCERHWPEATSLCLTFSIWDQSSGGLGVHLFATTERALDRHFARCSKRQLHPDLCVPEPLALAAYCGKWHPKEPSALLAHVEATYSVLLLLFDGEIAGYQVILAPLSLKEPIPAEVIAQLRQVLCSLKERAAQLSSCRPNTRRLKLVCTGLKARVDWASLANTLSSGENLIEPVQSSPRARGAIAEGLGELHRCWPTSRAHLAPLGATPCSVFKRAPSLQRSLKVLALSLCSVVGALLAAQAERLYRQTERDFAKLVDCAARFSKAESQLAQFADMGKRLPRNGRALKESLKTWRSSAEARPLGARQLLQWLVQSARGEVGLALRKLEICTGSESPARSSSSRVSLVVTANRDVDCSALAARLRDWSQIDRDLPETWRAGRGLLTASFSLKMGDGKARAGASR